MQKEISLLLLSVLLISTGSAITESNQSGNSEVSALQGMIKAYWIEEGLNETQASLIAEGKGNDLNISKPTIPTTQTTQLNESEIAEQEKALNDVIGATLIGAFLLMTMFMIGLCIYLYTTERR